MSWDIYVITLPTLLEVCLRYISYFQKEAFYEDRYDQMKELHNGKGNLTFRAIPKEAIALGSK